MSTHHGHYFKKRLLHRHIDAHTQCIYEIRRKWIKFVKFNFLSEWVLAIVIISVNRHQKPNIIIYFLKSPFHAFPPFICFFLFSQIICLKQSLFYDSFNHKKIKMILIRAHLLINNVFNAFFYRFNKIYTIYKWKGLRPS